ncbi:MAG TPA: M50 family metallopeptidase [Dongiaceae bacterium]|nr:M50 family metallopeptidase [Dongiaceae bacterium]
MLIIGIIVGLLVLVVLVALHELGHAIVASRNGVVVEEFGIGFPPRAWKKKLKNGVLFTLNWLPLGGFVKLQGEHDAAGKKGDYGAATFWQKTKILLAGVVINWLVAVLLLAGLALVGLPKILPDQFSVPSDTTIVTTPVILTQLTAGYPAEKAGLKAGDKVLTFAGEKITTSQQLIDVSKAHRGQTVPVEYERGGTDKTVNVTLRNADSAVFGSALGQQESIKATWSAPVVGVVTAAQYTWVTLQGLGNLIVNFFGGLVGQLSTSEASRQAATRQLNEAGASVAGPVGILGVIFPAASQAGPLEVIFLAAIISLTLAVMNTLPIPSLDGGRWFVTALFKVLKKPLTKEREEKIHGTGFMVLIVLIIVITIGDVIKLF